MTRAPLSPSARFWVKVERPGPLPEFCPDLGHCWMWVAGRNGEDSYGRFCISKGHVVYAHRFAYEEANGPIPEGLHIDHLCRVPSCVRATHLEAVVPAENTRRGLAGRLVTHCPSGHAYDEANTHWTKSKHRQCLKCAAMWTNARYHRRKAMGLAE